MRYYSRFIVLCLIFELIYCLPIAAQRPVGSWRSYFGYYEGAAICKANEAIWVGTKVGMFSVDLADGSLATYSKANGFSDIGLTALAYSPAQHVVVAGYQNGNIDLWQENGKVVNMGDVFRANIGGSKAIHQILCYENRAYIAADFGVVVIDLIQKEIVETYRFFIGSQTYSVSSLAIGNQYIAVATSGGLFINSLSNPLLVDASTWQMQSDLPEGEITQVVFNGTTFVAAKNSILYKQLNADDDWQPFYSNAPWKIKHMAVSDNNDGRIAVAYWWYDLENNPPLSQIKIVNPTGEVTNLTDVALRPIQIYFEGNTNTVWSADVWIGLQKHNINVPPTNILPAGPFSNSAFGLLAHQKELWVAPGGVDNTYRYKLLRDGLFRYSSQTDTWRRYSVDNDAVMNANAITDIIKLCPHPTQPIMYAASAVSGLVVLDYATNEIALYNHTNSSFQQSTGDPGKVRATGVAIDQNQVVWATHTYTTKPIVAWDTQNQTWYAFKPNLSLPDGNQLRDVLIDDAGQVWSIIHRNGILVLNHNNTLDDTSDDQYTVINSQDGLPVSEVTCMVKDQNGAIWLGTSEGVAVIYCPYSVMQTNGCPPVLPILEVEGYGAYLLKTEVITAIAVDGANRKWIGTEQNGIFVMSPDGTQLIHYFNKKNSPLPSDIITAITVNKSNGEVFIGTAEGIVSYQNEAIDGTNVHTDVLAYPNPVRPEYLGDIAIKGLAANATVKITDIGGNLVYQTQALGSQAIWDGRDYNGKRAASGVYLIYSTNSDGSDSFATKLLIINGKND